MKLLFIISTLFMTLGVRNEPELSMLRGLFYKSAEDKTAASKFFLLVANVNRNSTPLLICYKGVAEMMQAKHGFNPFNKLARFNSGRMLIEQSICKDPDNLELRFLRLSIQSNLPSFLGYKSKIEADKNKLITGLDQLKDIELKEKIVNYLLASKYCTEAELKISKI